MLRRGLEKFIGEARVSLPSPLPLRGRVARSRVSASEPGEGLGQVARVPSPASLANARSAPSPARGEGKQATPKRKGPAAAGPMANTQLRLKLNGSGRLAGRHHPVRASGFADRVAAVRRLVHHLGRLAGRPGSVAASWRISLVDFSSRGNAPARVAFLTVPPICAMEHASASNETQRVKLTQAATIFLNWRFAPTRLSHLGTFRTGLHDCDCVMPCCAARGGTCAVGRQIWNYFCSSSRVSNSRIAGGISSSGA
jgi:hypothetical protein